MNVGSTVSTAPNGRSALRSVSCFGVIVVDALSSPLERYPTPRTHVQVNTETLRFLPGGGAANTSAALAQLGVPVGLYAMIGDDPNGAFALDHLQAVGVNTDGVRVAKGDATPFTYVGVHPDGERTFIHTPGANLNCSLDDFDRDSLLACDFLMYQDCWCLPGVDGASGFGLLEAAKTKGVTTLIDECWGLGPNREVWETMMVQADYILPSYDDMLAIYPGRSPEELVKLLQGKGAVQVVLKLGKDGCLVSTPGSPVHIPSRAKEIVDGTGAGDCFDAGFIAGLTRNLDAVAAAGIGSLSAAACIANVGGASGIPGLEAFMSD